VFEFAYPWLLLALPLPLAVWWLFPPYREPVESVRVPFFHQISQAIGETPRSGAVIMRRTRLQWVVAPAVWLLIVAALARPQWVGAPIEKVEAARDIMIAIDVSGSMSTQDFTSITGQSISRLEAIKDVVGGFIDRRKGDRVGMIVFGSKAYVLVPFTQDLPAARTLLNGATVNMVGPQTMIGDAIGLTITAFEASKTKDRLLILLTDGNDSGSRMPPPKAAEIARQKGVKIYTIGVGDPKTQGDEKVDFDALRKISSTTRGQFFTAENRGALEAVYARIEELVPRKIASKSYRPKRDLYHWPLGFALGLMAAFFAIMALIELGQRRSRADA